MTLSTSTVLGFDCALIKILESELSSASMNIYQSCSYALVRHRRAVPFTPFFKLTNSVMSVFITPFNADE